MSEVVSDTSYGHLAPYVVSTILFSLNQHYTNNQLRSRSGDMQLTDIPALEDQTITVVVLADKIRFTKVLSSLGAPSDAKAYFDPRSAKLYFHFNPTLLRHFAYQEKWDSHTSEYFIDELRNYFYTLFLFYGSHEFFHFLQNASDSHFYSILPFREGAAIYAATNLTSRNEFQRLFLSENHVNRRESCVDAPKGRIFSLDEVSYYLEVAYFLRATPEFSITRWSLQEFGPKQFFNKDVELNYALSLVFYRFILSIDGAAYDDWLSILNKVKEGEDISSAGLRFDKYFWSETLNDTSRFFGESKISLDNALQGITSCFTTAPAVAYNWALLANSLAPGLPIVDMYIGDIFANANSEHSLGNHSTSSSSLTALYYYRKAYAGARKYWGLEEQKFCVDVPTVDNMGAQVADMIRIYSRIGESYYAIGSVENAIRYLECAVDYSNRVLKTKYAFYGLLFIPTTLSADLQLTASNRTIINDFQFSRKIFGIVVEAQSTLKGMATEIAPDYSKLEQIELSDYEDYVRQICLAYAIQAVALDADLSKIPAKKWTSNTSLCSWVRWNDGVININKDAFPVFEPH